jgi:hypothetical protein
MTKKQIVNYIIKKIKAQGGIALDYVGLCTLENEKGMRCAFSLCMKDSVRKKILSDDLSGVINDTLVGTYGGGNIDNMLLKKFHGHSLVFWKRLQEFHDYDDNWEEDGTLNEEGKREAHLVCIFN